MRPVLAGIAAIVTPIFARVATVLLSIFACIAPVFAAILGFLMPLGFALLVLRFALVTLYVSFLMTGAFVPRVRAMALRIMTPRTMPLYVTSITVAMRALLRVAARALLCMPASAAAISLRTRMSSATAVSATAALRGMAAAAIVVFVCI